MKLISLKIKWFKNLDFWDNKIDFTKSEWISIFVWNNWSWKSNVLEAISAIFYWLYDETNERRCAFSYELEYKINWKNIFIKQDFNLINGVETRWVWYLVDWIQTRDISDFLPSQIIALYSWEETRLYENYFQEYYQDFIISVKNNKLTLDWSTFTFDIPKMIFINKDFWNIALLTILVSIYDFETDELYKWLENILWKWIKINEIEFDINQENLDKFKQNNVTNFVKVLSSKNDWTLDSLREFQDANQIIWTHQDFFWNLSIACFWLTENDKLINNIVLKLDNNITLYDLSEWQKKQLLIYFVTNLLVSNNSMVLLDEPDSYIHVWNKQKLKNLFENYLLNFNWEWEILITTHSPTLMNKFDKKHIYYLENWKLDLKEKREILDKITDWQMSLNEMEILLNSWNKYLLVTEWITDKKHLEVAIEKLWIENNFDIYSADGCDKLKQFLIWLPRNIFKNKIVIWIFDYDKAWLDNVKVWEALKENKIYKVRDRNNIYWITLPCPDINFEKHSNCPIEMYYSKEILEENGLIRKRWFDEINRCIPNVKDKLNQKEIDEKQELFYFKVSESETSKNWFTEMVKELPISDFEQFKVLFDIILSF